MNAPNANDPRVRSHWGWGWADLEPTIPDQQRLAATIHSMTGWAGYSPTTPPKPSDVRLPAPRVEPPPSLAHICSADIADRARHSYGRAYRDVVRAFASVYDHPADVVARPANGREVAQIYEWADAVGAAVVPFGGGSSVVGGVNPAFDRPAIALDTERMSGLIDVDETSLAAHVRAGTYGPELNRQLAEYGLTLRHFPQSFEFSTVGGWIATRAGGHYATGRTHIDDFVESTSMQTPIGEWTSRRLPGSGAGPSPDRMVIGSEGTLGVITEAWIRVQRRPVFRASVSFSFRTLDDAANAVRFLAQSDLTPSNCRLLDPTEAMLNGVGDGASATLIVGFESADHALTAWLDRATDICRSSGGTQIDGSRSERSESTGANDGGRPAGAESQWRDAFLQAPYRRDVVVALGGIAETFETACTWRDFPEVHPAIVQSVQGALSELGLAGVISMRMTHAYPDGPAPYYTVIAAPASTAETPTARAADCLSAWDAIKAAASETIIRTGATITHHHAVGRDHQPFYERQRPDVFEQAFRAAKTTCAPGLIMNPGVLLRP